MLFGLIFCLVCGLLAMVLGALQNVVGGPMIGLFLGVILCNILPGRVAGRFKEGARFSSKYLLKLGIILAGGTLSFQVIIGVGRSSLPISIFNICLAFAVALVIGRALKLPQNTSLLVGGGTSICGGTAIATLAPIVEADEDEIAYAMTSIFLFDIFAALMWPYAARAMALTPWQYGILGGLAINDTSSVTAAGATFDALMGDAAWTVVNGQAISAGSIAVVIKLTRTVLLVFVALAVMLVKAFSASKAGAAASGGSFVKRLAKAFPVFVLGFLLLAVLNTAVDFSRLAVGPLSLGQILSKGSKYFISVALVGVGCKIKLRDLFTKGAKPVLLGGCTWVAVSLVTLAYLFLFT
jgi:uncharacterized integral membrane protein (TIGR00698 family)